jgi:hypothetical protein
MFARDAARGQSIAIIQDQRNNLTRVEEQGFRSVFCSWEVLYRKKNRARTKRRERNQNTE